MSEVEQTELDPAQRERVRDYLSAQLSPQTGRAEARFRQFLAAQNPAPEQRASIFRLPNQMSTWTIGLLGAALAATLAALWAGPSLKPVTPARDGSANVVPSTPVGNMLVEQDVQSQTFDDGTIMTEGNTPVRVLRRRDLERMRWFDQNKNLQGEQVVPRDHVIYMPVKTY